MTLRRTLMGGAAAVAATALLPPAAEAQRAARGRRGQQPAAPAPTGSPANTPLGPFDTVARQALLIDFDTQAVLLEKSADERMHPSSMSKLMTLYVVFSKLKEGSLRLDQELPVSEKAWRMGGSKMFVQVGTSVKVEDLIQGVIVHSGNDACIVLAEGIAGSESQFAEQLNEAAKKIGLTNSSFRNATGWPDPEHLMTCRDIASLASHLIRDFPEYYHFFNERSFRYSDITQENRNPVLSRVAGADGLKTGHTEEAGFGEVGSAKRGDRRLILVANGLTSMRQRGEESARLLEWGFREFDNVVLFRAEDVVEQVPVYLGSSPTVPLVGGRDLVLTVPTSWRRTLQAKIQYQSPITAPVAKGQELGTLNVSGTGVPQMSLPLIAGADVSKLNIVMRVPAVIGRWVSGS